MHYNQLFTTITFPTRIDPNHHTSSLIDVTLTTITQTVITADPILPPISDHIPTLTRFQTRDTFQHHPTPCPTNNTALTDNTSSPAQLPRSTQFHSPQLMPHQQN
eukprot:Pompholyxophrys_punicea_v1_NODE_361_length_2161_cov_4.612061.p3 type:complete len:105 gc:universal NODE_361_length_2161_cov_4.612061:959-645(-)